MSQKRKYLSKSNFFLFLGFIFVLFSLFFTLNGQLLFANILLTISIFSIAFIYKKTYFEDKSVFEYYAFFRSKIGLVGTSIIIFFALTFIIGFIKYGLIEKNVESFKIFGDINHLTYVLSGINVLVLIGLIIALVIIYLKFILELNGTAK